MLALSSVEASSGYWKPITLVRSDHDLAVQQSNVWSQILLPLPWSGDNISVVLWVAVLGLVALDFDIVKRLIVINSLIASITRGGFAFLLGPGCVCWRDPINDGRAMNEELKALSKSRHDYPLPLYSSLNS